MWQVWETARDAIRAAGEGIASFMWTVFYRPTLNSHDEPIGSKIAKLDELSVARPTGLTTRDLRRLQDPGLDLRSRGFKGIEARPSRGPSCAG